MPKIFFPTFGGRVIRSPIEIVDVPLKTIYHFRFPVNFFMKTVTPSSLNRCYERQNMKTNELNHHKHFQNECQSEKK